MIDVEFKSEERYIRLSVAYEGNEEKEKVHSCMNRIIAKQSMKADTHTSQILNNREVLVVEYQDEDYREVGKVFDEIMKALEIKECI
ncbi:MAG: hypothetical protein Q9M32_00485 [Sulfurimonas sp.]|nr:hypothetical protein [Sulfurimonas sp.]MDQ7061643.1 hypothetical protein [Sulfurimonas sp.]